MKIQELIEQLKKLPPDGELLVLSNYHGIVNYRTPKEIISDGDSFILE